MDRRAIQGFAIWALVVLAVGFLGLIQGWMHSPQ